jgi:hypothetical protein
VPRALGARATVSHVTAGGRGLSARLVNPTTLVVPVRLAAGKRIDVSMRWRLTLPRRGGDRVWSSHDGVRLGSFFPILAWEPGRGWALDPPPRMPAESSTSPTADFDLRIAAPAGLTVLATGMRVGPGRWVARAVRDVAVAAGRFTVVRRTVRSPGRVRVSVAVRRDGPVATTGSPFARSGTPQQYLDRAARALRVLSRLYGTYPWPALTAVVERDLSPTGGIEYPTVVFLGHRSLLTAVAHETAHQWFYSLVGNDQGRDPWLDEGVATWAQTQVDPASLPYFTARPVPADARNRVGAPIVYWNLHRRSYAAGVYAQGVRALAALGAAARVNCGLRRYVARHAYGIATQAELVHELNAVIPGSATTLRRFGVRA